MDYDRTHQSHLESKYKGQKQNGTFLSFHPLLVPGSKSSIFPKKKNLKNFLTYGGILVRSPRLRFVPNILLVTLPTHVITHSNVNSEQNMLLDGVTLFLITQAD